MLSIRLSRVGTKKRPVYRIVVMPKHRDPWADVTEILGHYDPRKQPRELVVKADRVKHWLQQGAQATDTVWNLLVDEKIVEGEKRGVTTISKKRKGKLEEKSVAAKEKAEAAKAKAAEEAEAKKAADAEAKEKAAEEAKAAKEAEAAAPAEETPAEEPAKEEAAPAEETPAEEKTEEAPAEEAKAE